MSLRTRHARKKRHDVRRVLLASIGGLVCAGTLVAAHSFTLVRDSLRADACDAVNLGQNTKIFDRKQKLLSTIAAETNRESIPLEKMPQYLIDAVVATEDKKFYRHHGIDYDRIAGAAIRDALGNGGGRQGGSTITMQLMRNLCHPNEPRSVSIKLAEAYLAKSFEKRYSKRVILQRYLNSVFFGNNAIGVQAASLTYFSRDTKNITLSQAALLAGLPQAPSAYNPFKNPDAAKGRRNLVLDEMVEEGFITPAQAVKAKKAGLGLRKGNAFGLKREGYFVDYIEQILTGALGRRKTRTGGYRVYTTINPKLQQAARQAMRKVLTSYSSDPPSAALVMIDARTGRVLTMASSEEYNRKNQFNVAGPEAKRQAGSTFKTFVLTTALKEGVSPNTRYFSKSPVYIKGSECAEPVGPAKVETYGRTSRGSSTIASATVASDNSVYAQMTCDLGPGAVYETAREMGITSMVPNIDRYNIALGLGGLNRGVNVLEMARAYAPLANGGYRVTLLPMTKLVRPDGKATLFKPQRTRIFSDGVAAEVTKILRQNVIGGTGTAANLPNVPVAGKTGTVDDFTDAWFVGYTPKYVTAVWVGYPNQKRPMPGQTGGKMPASIWRAFMEVATKGESGQVFSAPTTPFVSQPFSGYWSRQAAALAAAEAAKKAAAEEAKKKAEEEAKKKEEGGQPGQPGTEPTAPGTTPPGTPPAGGTPPTGGVSPPAGGVTTPPPDTPPGTP